MPVFGRFGFRKTSMEDLAKAAGLSKQGLYLHFSSKDELFLAAMQRHLDVGLELVDQVLARKDLPLVERLAGAMDAWFGRHLATFAPESLDVIPAGNHLSADPINSYKLAFQRRLAATLSESSEFDAAHRGVSPDELSKVLFIFGLTWKEGRPSAAEFQANVRLCIRACLA